MAKTFHGYVLGFTHKAVIADVHTWELELPHFIPLSQCDILVYPDTMEVEFVLTDWICEQKGVEE